MSERFKLADMTLGQIKELKSEMSKAISGVIAKTIQDFDTRYDVGDTDVEVFTDVNVIKDNYGDIIHRTVSYETKITFSDEETD